MSTAGLELSSFINPKLTWKTVSKGRSTSRRSRRTISKNTKMGQEQNQSPKRLESRVSESGKVTGIARRYGDSMEHIPIKKRRFLFRSPSPSPQSPHDESGGLEETTSATDHPMIAVSKKSENDSFSVETSIRDADDSTNDGKKLKATDEVRACGDDFSGIAILAAAACNDMLDKPCANTLSAFEDSVKKGHINSPKENIIDGSLPGTKESISTAERTKTATASCDDRLHWDLNAPMDEWDHPFDDTIVDSAVKVDQIATDVNKEQANVCTVKEPSVQPILSRVNTGVASSDVTHNISRPELEQKKDCHTGNGGLITAEAVSELNQNAPDIRQIQVVDRVRTFKEQSIGSSSCMKDEIIPSVISHVPMVDRFEIVDHCLRLGSNDAKTSLSGGKSLVAVSDPRDVSIEGSASAVVVDNTVKSEMDLLLKPVSMVAESDIDIAPCEGLKSTTETLKSAEIKNELPEFPFQHYPMPPEKQDVAFSTVGASVNDAPAKCFNVTSHFKVNKGPAEISNSSEVKTDMSTHMGQLDAKGSETASVETSNFQEQACNIHVPNCKDIVVPEKKNELDCTSCSLGDVAQPADLYPIGSEFTVELNHAGTSCYSSQSEIVGASTSNDGKSAKYSCEVEMKNESGVFDGHEAQTHMKIEKSLAVKGDDSHDVDLKELPSEDSSDRVLRLQVSHEECSQVVSTGLEGGYDSYLEDGELREHHWADNDGNNRESELDDCDFNNRGENKFTDAASEPIAEKVVAVVCEKQAKQLHEGLRSDDELPAAEKKIEEDQSCLHHDSFLSGGDVGEDCLKANPSTSNSIFVTPLSAMDNPEVVDMDLDDGRKSSIVSDDLKGDENDFVKDTGDVYFEGAGMKDSRREMQSQIEGPYSSYRRGNHVTPRSRYSNFSHSYYRDERQIGVDESLGRGRSLHLECGGRIGNRYWNRGLRSVVSDHAAEGDNETFVGPSNDESLGAHQQGMFPGSRGGYTHLARKGSPAGRGEGYDMGLVKVRDVDSESGQKNRYDRHVSGLSRGPREAYRGPIYESPNSSSSMSNHFIKRERSFSPGGSRVEAHHPRSHRRSRSRSRTQSPDLRPDDRMGRTRVQYQNADYFRERRAPFRVFGQGQRFDNNSGRLRSENCLRPGTRPVRFIEGLPSGRAHDYENDNDCKRKTYPPRSYRRSRSKSRSCSPEFRNEARMGRMRAPYAALSHTRDHMTDRRSPQRMFHSGKRFDTVGSPPSRLRSGDYMRPIVRPMRFQDNAQPSRGNEYEGDEYRRKPRTIFDRIRPTRNYEMEGDGRRFEYDAEDSIATQSFHRGDAFVRGADRRPGDDAFVRGADRRPGDDAFVRGADRRPGDDAFVRGADRRPADDAFVRGADRRPADVVRGVREETSNTRYNNSERIYSTGPKQFGIREYSDDALPRRMRPE